MFELTINIASSPWYWVILGLCILVSFICLKYGSKITGWFGEKWTKDALDSLDKDKYIVLNDIMIKTKDFTHQIDHIVLSKYGIFVIETKQYNGYITGNKYDKKWVCHYKNKQELLYTNPIRQNYGHVMAICELLNISKDKVFNIVCIPSAAKLNITHDGELTRMDNLASKIKSYDKEIINNIDEIKDIILKNNITDSKERQAHIDRLKELYKDNYDVNTCPRCGNKLIEKNGKYGKFLGCSDYPKCDYTRNINVKVDATYESSRVIKYTFFSSTFIKYVLIFFIVILGLSFISTYLNSINKSNNPINPNSSMTEEQKKTIDRIKEIYASSKEKGFEIIHTNECNEISNLFGSNSFKCDRFPLIINVSNNLITIYKDFNLYSLELNEDSTKIAKTNKKYVGNYTEDGVAVGYLHWNEANEYYNRIGGIDKIKEMATYSYTNNAFVSKYYDSSHIVERGGNKYNNYSMIVDMFFSALTGRGYDIKASSTNKEETNKMCEAFYYIMK